MTLSVYPVRAEYDVGGTARVSWELKDAPVGAKDLTLQLPKFVEWKGPDKLPTKGTAEVAFKQKGKGSLKVCYKLKQNTICDSVRLAADATDGIFRDP
jgi:hypothetical protein